MFKYHRKDSLLVLVLFIQLILLFLPYGIMLSTKMLVLLIFINAFLVGTNYQCVAHNFIHLPFFKSNRLNQLFSCLNTLGILIPQSLYRIHHLHHHRHNNRPEEDESSTRRYGKDGQDENIFAYSILGIFRTDLISLYKQASKNSDLAKTEFLCLILVLSLQILIDWKLFFGYTVISYLLGMFFALWENYCEHHRADPYDRKRDSVSCYNRFYNLIWFNNGYHQEHHFSPQVHWTQVQRVRDDLPSDRVIVKGCHLTNSF